MKWFLNTASDINLDGFAGIFTAPYHSSAVAGIRNGALWAADNQAFTTGFKPDKFFPWLDRMLAYRSRCMFVTIPDVVGNAQATIDSYWQWSQHFTGWPLAFVAQDEQEKLDFPGIDWNVLFIGGSTKWKEGIGAIECIKRAQTIGKHIHIGRVNTKRRYQLFRMIKGSDCFTCDGTHHRFVGMDNAKRKWRKYQDETNVMELW